MQQAVQHHRFLVRAAAFAKLPHSSTLQHCYSGRAVLRPARTVRSEQCQGARLPTSRCPALEHFCRCHNPPGPRRCRPCRSRHPAPPSVLGGHFRVTSRRVALTHQARAAVHHPPRQQPSTGLTCAHPESRAWDTFFRLVWSRLVRRRGP